MVKNIFTKKLTSIITAVSIAASLAVMPISAMAASPAADDGTVGGISNGGEWSIYASKIGKITADSGSIQDVTDSDGVVEATKEKRSAALQFDLSSKDKADKVIKSAKLRLTMMVSKTNLQQTVSVISNEFVDTTDKTPIAEFTAPRVGTDDFNKDTNITAITDVTEYPTALKNWQTDVDITGEVIGAGDTLSLHVAYASGNANKAEYATCNAASNARLNGGAVPFLYGSAATDYIKWVYPQLVFTYTDNVDYKAAYTDFVAVSNALSEAVITADEGVSAPAVNSTVTLEPADEEGLVTITDNTIAYNTNYAGSAKKANVKLTVTNGEASYSRIVPISVDAVESYKISFDTAKNPLGEISVAVGNTNYTDGTAYAQANSTVTVNGGANTGYTASISVKKASDNSEIVVTDGSFTMPAEEVNVSVEYAKQSQYGTTRIAAANSISIKDTGDLQSPDLVIGANRVTFVKFDLSEYSADDISRAEMDFTLTKGTVSTTKAIFYVPNNDWSESSIDKNFKLDGTDDTDISNFKYTNTEGTEETVSLLSGENHAALIIPNADDASSASEGILKDYYITSTGTQTTNSINIADVLAEVLSKSADGIITFMIYNRGSSSNDVYSVNGAPNLSARPSLTITEEDAENRSYAVNFDTAKNPMGEMSVTVDDTTYTDGTAYAKEGSKVIVNDGANTGYTANITVKKSDDSEIEVTDGSFIMPSASVSVSAEYAKPNFGTTRISAANSISIRDNGALQSPDLVIGANRVTFVKFDLSGYNADVISEADMSFTLTKNATLNTKAVFYVPNNDWNESNISKDFCIDGTADTNISNFKYTDAQGAEATVSLLNGENHAALIIPNTDDASTAADGILKNFYVTSTGTQKTCTISITDVLKTALKNSQDSIVTFMVYSAGGGNDIYSVSGAGSLSARPSITITESSEFLPDDELITEIKTVADLENFAEIVNGGNSYSGKTVTLANTLDLSKTYNSESGKSWTPIGAETTGGLKSFAGTFEGQNHTISGLYINNTGITLGLFGDVSGTIKDLTVTGEIKGSSVIGGIAASCDGTITNCHSNVAITAQREAGGIVGTLANGGVVSNSDNHGNIMITNKETYVGGIVGHNIEGLVKDCNNSGKIENGMDGFRNRLGGIVGFLDNGRIENSTNAGEVISNATVASYTGDTTQNYVGGIVGYSSYGTVTNCTNNSRIYNAVPYAGGVAGYLMRGSLHNCSYDKTLNDSLEIVGYNAEGTITYEDEPTPSTITVYAEDGIIIVATYNTDKSLLKVEIAGEVKANDEVQEIQTEENQKAFVWTSFKDMKPVASKQIPAV